MNRPLLYILFSYALTSSQENLALFKGILALYLVVVALTPIQTSDDLSESEEGSWRTITWIKLQNMTSSASKQIDFHRQWWLFNNEIKNFPDPPALRF